MIGLCHQVKFGFMTSSPPAGAAETLSSGSGMIIIGITALLVLLLIAIGLASGRNKRLERELVTASREADLHLQSIARSANVLISRFDGTGRRTHLGPGLSRLTGIPTESFLEDERLLLDRIHPEDRASYVDLESRRGLGSEDSFEIEYRLKGREGRWHWIHERQSPLIVDGKMQGHESVAFDFTDRVRFEEQQRRLLHLEQLSTTFLESFLVTDDIRGTTRRMLDVLGRYFNFSGAKILERNAERDEFDLVHAWNHERSWQAEDEGESASISGERISWWIEQVRGGVPFTVAQDDLRRDDGDEVHQITDADSVMIVPILVLGRLEMLILIEDEEEQRSWQPEELATIQTMAHAIARSVERQLIEEDRAEFAEYRRMIERTEIIGHLASGIAHDFNNIVFAVSGRTQLLLRRTEDEKIREGLEQIEMALADAKGVIGALRMMNSNATQRTGVVCIAPSARRLTGMIRRLIPNRIRLDLEIDVDNEVAVSFSADALLQVLMNLVVNARDAVQEEGRIRITVDELGTGDHPVRMIVEDDGPGIPETMHSEVLKPFVSSKDADKGTGLGLSIVARVIRDHVGTLEFSESDLGGLRVTVGMERGELPDAEEPVSETSSPSAKLNRVCIVEDEPMIRNLIARPFEEEGIEVVLLPDALSVADLVGDPDEGIDILIMDVDLPEMTGIECLTSLRENGNMIPCVLMTGGFNEPPENTENMQMMRKPFSMESLLAMCGVLVSEHRRGLDSPGSAG